MTCSCHQKSDFFTKNIDVADPEVAKAIKDELDREQNQIELIASENIVSKAVLEAQGSVMTNKYAEGYSGHRYYGGCEFVDVVETLAIERAKKLFNAGFANVGRYMIFGLVGANFIFELVANLIFSPLIVRVIKIGKKE